jgi:energy-coupling factor transporter transmembrane protein EcfT
MEVIKSILNKPYLVVLLAAFIAIVTPNRYSFYSLAVIFTIFTVSIIYTIIQKKWLRLFLSFLGFFGFFIAWIGFIFIIGFSNDLKPEVEIGDAKFYKNEIKKSSNLKIFKELKLISKLDTIKYIGMGGDYDAECLYTGPRKLIIDLEEEVISQKEFNKVKEIEDTQTTNLKENNFNLKELKSLYKKESEGGCIIYIGFDKNNSKLYYSAYYY